MTNVVHRLRNPVGMVTANVMQLNQDAANEIERLRKGIQDYLDGNYGTRIPKIDKCSHGSFGYEACEGCIDEHFAKLLRDGDGQ